MSDYEKSTIDQAFIVIAPLINLMNDVIKNPTHDKVQSTLQKMIKALPRMKAHGEECERALEITKLLIAQRKSQKLMRDKLNDAATNSRKLRESIIESIERKQSYSSNLQILKTLDHYQQKILHIKPDNQ